MKKGLFFLVTGFIAGFWLSFIIVSERSFNHGVEHERTRMKSPEEIIQMADRTLKHDSARINSQQKEIDAERKKMEDAAKKILRLYLPPEQKKTEGGEK